MPPQESGAPPAGWLTPRRPRDRFALRHGAPTLPRRIRRDDPHGAPAQADPAQADPLQAPRGKGHRPASMLSTLLPTRPQRDVVVARARRPRGSGVMRHSTPRRTAKPAGPGRAEAPGPHPPTESLHAAPPGRAARGRRSFAGSAGSRRSRPRVAAVAGEEPCPGARRGGRGGGSTAGGLRGGDCGGRGAAGAEASGGRRPFRRPYAERRAPVLPITGVGGRRRAGGICRDARHSLPAQVSGPFRADGQGPLAISLPPFASSSRRRKRCWNFSPSYAPSQRRER